MRSWRFISFTEITKLKIFTIAGLPLKMWKSKRFLTMSRLSISLYHEWSCTSKHILVRKNCRRRFPAFTNHLISSNKKIVCEIYDIHVISSDATLPIFHLGLSCSSSRDILIEKNTQNIISRRAASLSLIIKKSCANLCANQTKMDAGGCPSLNMNAMWSTSVNSDLSKCNIPELRILSCLEHRMYVKVPFICVLSRFTDLWQTSCNLTECDP